ncbi:MAG TPA: (d)CMP kinase [Anaerolineae bacterium]|nr:(d)CMP kinase [Caldilineae bacterium]HID35673.1 (d)CMP kinase [Anaerolineae bacterium]HIQ12386.1 (d)CMP kinase [Caldilineales bacterium]
MSTIPPVIAIDGPAASGKSTVGKLVAETLGFLLFDTGALYRAVTLTALRRGIPIEDEACISDLARTIHIDLIPSQEKDGRPYTVLVDGEDLTWAIRSEPVDAHVSAVSAYPGVREALKHQQRRIAWQGKVVMAGRDIGTVVFPEAPLKVYLDATPEVRARRRCEELRARGEEADFDEILAGVRRRDAIDSTRAMAPLRIADDAVVINTDDMTVDEVVDAIVQLARERFDDPA